MNRSRVCQMSAFALVGLLVAELPAFAQVTPVAPPPPPTEAAPPPPVSSPPMAPPPGPRSTDDMTGALGFGVGLIGNAELFGTTGQVAVKYWMQDNMALVPALNLTINKTMGTDAAWIFNPEAVVLFVPFKSTATRLLVGGGLGFGVGKAAGAMDTTFTVNIPIQGGVEHFFTRWFSLGIAARTNLFNYSKTGDVWNYGISINTAALLGSLFFYTD